MERMTFDALMCSSLGHWDDHFVGDVKVCAHEEDDDQKLHNYAAALDQRRGNDHLKEETVDKKNPHQIPNIILRNGIEWFVLGWNPKTDS